MKEPRAQAYLLPEHSEPLKVERVHDKNYVVNFPDGPERRSEHEIKKGVHLGEWEDYQLTLALSSPVAS